MSRNIYTAIDNNDHTQSDTRLMYTQVGHPGSKLN